MAYNGSGQFIRSYDWTTDAANGLNIEASRMDTEDDGFATGLSTAICKDGQTTTTQPIPFAAGIQTDTVAERTSGLGVEIDGLLCKDGTIETEKGSNVASAATTNIWTAGNFKLVSGTATITSFGTPTMAGAYRVLYFSGACTLTHSSSILLPGQANITTAADDSCIVYAYTASAAMVVSYTKAAVAPSGGAAVMVSTFDAKGDLLAGTGADTYSKLTAGANGTFLVAQSGQATGLAYQTINDYTTDASPATGDFVFTYDISASAQKKVALSALQTLIHTAVPYAKLSDEKASGTSGGTATSGSYATRTLNTEVDTGSIVTLSSNQFTLAAGTYNIRACAPAQNVTSHKIKLRNTTDSTDTIIGTTENTNSAGISTRSSLAGQFTIAGSKTYEIQHRVETTTATTGFGEASSFGDVEVYTVVELWKIA